MNVPLPNNGTAPVDTINRGVGRTTIIPLNLFPETIIFAGETSTSAATVGQFPPVTLVVASEGIIQFTTAQYTALQEQMHALQAKVNGRVKIRRPPRVPNTRSDNPRREQVAQNSNREVPQEEDPERCNPRSRAQLRKSCSPSVYTRSCFVETPRGVRYQVHKGDLCDHLNAVFKARSETPRNRDEPVIPNWAIKAQTMEITQQML
uniref:Uncharacterized protein n=1 Tax=Cannabis sativa TaxID=3483 RepID=A0A803PBP3_CANSA